MKTSLTIASLALAGLTTFQGRSLTANEARLLEHFQLVEVPTGNGTTVTTVVLTGVNLQLVNGLGSTHSENGAGNLILGYNETGNIFGDDRTGSHCLVYGTQANFTSSSGIVGGIGNSLDGLGGVILSGSQNRVADGALLGVIASGFSNDITPGGGGGFIGAGENNHLWATDGAIVGGISNTAGEGFAVVIGGGSGNSASGIATTVGGGTARINVTNGSWRGGSFFSPQ